MSLNALLHNEANNISNPNNGFEPFMLSFCPSATTPEKQERAAFGWKKPYTLKNEEQFLSLITSIPYAQTIFRPYDEIPEDVLQKGGGYKKSTQRSSRNAIGITDTMIIDVDSGLSIKEASDRLDQFGARYCIVSTKSHTLKESDRFRVFVFLSWEKNPKFAENGIAFDESEAAIKKNQMIEIKFLKIEIAKALGFFFEEDTKKDQKLNEVDLGALTDIARKFMPSPPVGDPRHYFHARWDLPKLDISRFTENVRKRTKEYLLEERNKEHLTAIRFQSDTSLAEKMAENPSWKIVYDKRGLYSTNPFAIVYHYESEFDPNTRMLSEWTERPRTKRSGHECAIYYNSENGEYTIHDFVTTRHYNLLSFMEDRFPWMNQFEIMLKLQTEFSHEFGGKKLIYDNPYYYLGKCTELFMDESITSMEQFGDRLKEECGVIDISMKNNKMIIKKGNGYSAFFYKTDDKQRVDGFLTNHESYKNFLRLSTQFLNRITTIQQNKNSYSKI